MTLKFNVIRRFEPLFAGPRGLSLQALPLEERENRSSADKFESRTRCQPAGWCCEASVHKVPLTLTELVLSCLRHGDSTSCPAEMEIGLHEGETLS